MSRYDTGTGAGPRDQFLAVETNLHSAPKRCKRSKCTDCRLFALINISCLRRHLHSRGQPQSQPVMSRPTKAQRISQSGTALVHAASSDCLRPPFGDENSCCARPRATWGWGLTPFLTRCAMASRYSSTYITSDSIMSKHGTRAMTTRPCPSRDRPLIHGISCACNIFMRIGTSSSHARTGTSFLLSSGDRVRLESG